MRATVEGREFRPARSKKARWLLALLVLRRGRQIERSWVAGTLWPELREGNALRALRTTLCDLRQALGSEAWRLTSPTPRTLCFNTEGAVVDVVKFDEALASRDLSALRTIDSNLRGRLLEDCPEDWAVEECLIREQGLLHGLESAANAATLAGDHMSAAWSLRRMLDLEPWHENWTLDLMRAEEKQGNFVGALKAYRNLRTALREHAKCEPSADLQEIARKIARSHRGGSPARMGDGLEPIRRAPSTLPNPITRLVGRESVLEEIEQRLLLSRLSTLVGSGGVGKTRIALELAHRNSSLYSDGAAFVDLTAATDPSHVEATIAAALNIKPSSEQGLFEGIVQALGGSEILLVVDNCEHVLHVAASTVARLLERCRGMRILATSRRQLRVTGEAVYNVPPMNLPPESSISEFDLGSESTQLFIERANQACPQFLATLENASFVIRICRRLEGIPLAIEMAAARIANTKVEDLARGIEDRFEKLESMSPIAHQRHQTLDATLDWSYVLLTKHEQSVLRRLGIFVGGASESGVAFLCGFDRNASEVVAALASLVESSLIRHDSVTHRYTMLETVRHFSLSKLEESGESAAVRERYAAYFLEMAQRESDALRGPNCKAALARLDEEYANIRSALESCIQATNGSDYSQWGWEMAARIAFAMRPFWIRLRHVSEGLAYYLQIASIQFPGQSLSLRAELLRSASMAAQESGDSEAASQLIDEARSLAKEAGDRVGEAKAIHWKALIAGESGNPLEVVRLSPEVLSCAEELGLQALEGTCRTTLGLALLALGRFEEAKREFEVCLAMNVASNDLSSIGVAQDNLGHVARAQGHYGEALGLYKSALANSREAQHWSEIDEELEAVGSVFVATGRTLDAVRLWGASHALRKKSGFPKTPAGREGVDMAMATARKILGDAVYDSEFEAGSKLELDEAINLATND